MDRVLLEVFGLNVTIVFDPAKRVAQAPQTSFLSITYHCQDYTCRIA
jgi:hypothetical protein